MGTVMVMHGSISQRENRISPLSFCFFTVCYSLLYHSPIKWWVMIYGVFLLFFFFQNFYWLISFFFFILFFSLREWEREGKKMRVKVKKKRKEKDGQNLNLEDFSSIINFDYLYRNSIIFLPLILNLISLINSSWFHFKLNTIEERKRTLSLSLYHHIQEIKAKQCNKISWKREGIVSFKL